MLSRNNFMDMEYLENIAYQDLKHRLIVGYGIPEKQVNDFQFGEYFLNSRNEYRKYIFLSNKNVDKDDYRVGYFNLIKDEIPTIIAMIQEENEEEE